MSELRQGTYKPGTRITEQSLAEMLQVSRTPIREALNQLLEQGILHGRPRGGYVVPSPSAEQIRHIIAVRMLLEPAAVGMAAKEYGAEQIARMDDAIEMEAAATDSPNPAEFAAGNEQFRRAVFDGIANQALWGIIAQFSSHLDLIRSTTLKDIALRQEIIGRQKAVRDAIHAREGDLAEALWRSYLRRSEETLVQALEEIAESLTSDQDA